MIGKIQGYDQTLCWSCANAVPSADGRRGCSWSRKQKPVEGWTAVRRDIKYVNHRGGTDFDESYFVSQCPEFING